MARRIHVVGSSPRTGTTLLAELLVMGFEIDAFASHERSIFRRPHVPCDTYVSKNPQDVRVARQLLLADPDLFVLHMVRDPRDVVVSRHARDPEAYWTSLYLWKLYRKAAVRLEGAPRLLTLRYEDLVRDPDGAQDRIAGLLPFLKHRQSFSAFHRFADPPALSREALGGVRPIDASSVGIWRRHKPRVAAQIARHGPIDRDLVELGYEPDRGWHRELEGVVPDNGRTHLREVPLPLHERLSRRLRQEARLRRYRRRLRSRAGRTARHERVGPPADPGPFRTLQVRAGEALLEVGVLGEGTTALLIPGEGRAATQDLGELGRAVAAAGFRAVALNPRGVGASRGPLDGLSLHDFADDAASVIEHFGAPAHVVGHGFGNRVARCLACDHPDAVRSVTLLAAGGLVPPRPAEKPVTSERKQRPWRAASRAQRIAGAHTPLREWWSGGRGPLLVIQGLDDATAPPENGRALLREGAGRVRLIEVEGAGHRPHRDRPDLVLPAVVAFLREVEDARKVAPEGS